MCLFRTHGRDTDPSRQVWEQLAMYEAVIGIEVHTQLSTRSKVFCRCRADVFGAAPNTLVCPVCLGLPGSLPVINQRAVEHTVALGLALNCQVPAVSRFYRKNYHYPDLVKGYQITMYDVPLCEAGWIDLEADGAVSRIGITRVHLEEETGKSMHVEGQTLVDFNRSGLPLAEIVTEPGFRSLEEVRVYMLQLQQLLRYLGVSSGDMEKGALRIEPNVSLRPAGSSEMGTKVELKNLNSFRAVLRGLEYEIARQQELLQRGESVFQETRGWDEARQVTFAQRSKEYASDYRYFPEPDLPPLRLDPAWVEAIRAGLPELPWVRRARFGEQYALRPYDAGLLTDDWHVADFYEAAVAEITREGLGETVSPQTIAHWVTGEVFRLLKESSVGITETLLKPGLLLEAIALVEEGTVTSVVGKELLERAFVEGSSPRESVQQRALARIASREALYPVVAQVIADNPDVVRDYLGGKETAIRFFIGQVMRATRGQADPHLAAALLREQLNETKDPA